MHHCECWAKLVQHCNRMFCLVRTDPGARPQAGISFLLVDDLGAPGIEIRPIRLINGHHHFNEVFFDDVRVPVENPAKVTIDQTSGTVLAGEGVLISPCVVGLSELTISIVEDETVYQPGPLSQGETARVGSTRVEVSTNNKALKKVGGGATVANLLQNLEALNLTPVQLVSVFQALDQGGFLHARLEVR